MFEPYMSNKRVLLVFLCFDFCGHVAHRQPTKARYALSILEGPTPLGVGVRIAERVDLPCLPQRIFLVPFSAKFHRHFFRFPFLNVSFGHE